MNNIKQKLKENIEKDNDICIKCADKRKDHDVIETQTQVFRVCNVWREGKRCGCDGGDYK